MLSGGGSGRLSFVVRSDMKRRIAIVGVFVIGAVVCLSVLISISGLEAPKSVAMLSQNSELVDSPDAGNHDERMTLTLRNEGRSPVSVSLRRIESDSDSGWMADWDANDAGVLKHIGKLQGNESSQFSVIVPQGETDRKLTFLVFAEATKLQKARFALRLAYESFFAPKKQTRFWIDNLSCPPYELTLDTGSTSNNLAQTTE